MELRQLRYLASIVESGSISRAAQRLYVAQSALSQQLSKLEAELNTKLLHRTATGIRLTEDGRKFCEHANQILRNVEDAKRAFSDNPNTPVGTVTLGIPQSVSAALALPLFVAAKQRLPRVTLLITEELTGNLENQLIDERLDMSVLFDDGKLNRFDYKALAREQLFLVSTPDFLGISISAAISPSDALRQPLILPSYPHGVRIQVERMARSLSQFESNLVAEINSVAILRSALLAKLGATILPMAPVRDLLDTGLLVAQEIASPAATRTLCLCTPSGAAPSQAGAAVSKLVAEVVGTLCEDGRWLGAAALNVP
ncbi:LysR family transcriptional regulator [Noviherbaspirillum saxi]|uniref:LysR family transcriptional regulator n=1 Tax=Noviherbaspirillum saxi TaxID=2320863 RepID=A0A3A3FM06_9BURK|nr:LysR substrate-binding domain-containing protein [Noviherbaspirillum saxi]RJF95515.1 LysR family transcriptional regulator [Noviherbaspirillum saxi]